jgi:hypothetical protein
MRLPLCSGETVYAQVFAIALPPVALSKYLRITALIVNIGVRAATMCGQ